VPAHWTAVGKAITEQLAELGMKQKDLAAGSSVSVATIREIQAGKERDRNPRVLQALSRELGWPSDHLARVLEGQQPGQQSNETPEAERPANEQSAFIAKLAAVLEHRIGHIVDVIYNNGSDIDITIEIRHSPREQ
jgi:transcriptional regulator with XRE-family HTH domain